MEVTGENTNHTFVKTEDEQKDFDGLEFSEVVEEALKEVS